MRVVSLNLDHGDASVVRRAVRQALDACPCVDVPGMEPCPDCQALTATLSELDRLVRGPAYRRSPMLTVVAANGHGAPVNGGARELSESQYLRLLAGNDRSAGNR